MKRNTSKSSSSCTRMDRGNTLLLRGLTALSAVFLVAIAFGWSPDRIGTVNAAQVQNEKVTDGALSQIRSLIEAKLARTPAQQKLDSNLLAAIRVSRGEPIAANVPTLQHGVEFETDGKVLVDIEAIVTEELLGEIKQGGGVVVSSFEQYDAIRARIPLTLAEPLADLANVKFIRRAVKMTTQRAAQDRVARGALSRPSLYPPFALRASGVRGQLPHALSAIAHHKKGGHGQFVPNIGSANSAGDVAHRAAEARIIFGVNGAGVKIGVLSDSFNNSGAAAIDVLTGDLPGPGNPNGFTTPVTVLQDLSSGGTDEGRAMLQIVHDLAPGAQLYFATAFGGPANFANNIQALRNNGCAVIIDDIFYFNESPFQDAIIAQAVNTVTASGALYFSSAGNSGNLNDGTSGVWEGDFNDSGSDFILDGNNVGRLHRFNVSTILNTITAVNNSARSDLSWSDALGQSANDYDLYILNAAGTTVLRFSDDSQTGFQDPYEFVDTINAGEKIAVVKFSGGARALHLSTGRGRLAVATSGQTVGHSCAVNAFGVAAVDAARANGGAFTGGSGNPVEPFSSDGTRRIFYNPNGTAITPGNFLFATNGGTVRQKPDIAAADGVATTLPPGSGLNPFFGTSAAAPHAGAIAGLLKAFVPTLTTAQVRTALTGTALDIEAAGIDRDSGFGIVMAFQALQSVAPTGVGDTIGVYLASTRTFFLRNSNSVGLADVTVQYGPLGAVPVVGDWDGNGTTTLGAYDPSSRTFYLRNSNTPGFADLTIQYGPSGAIPVVGDWDGNGTTTLGVYDPSSRTFYLRNSNTIGFADLTIQYGPAGAIPVVGDWNGNGTTTIGVYDSASRIFYLRNSNSVGVADLTVQYGPSAATPAVGDFDGNGTVTIGVYLPSDRTFYLRNSNSVGFADLAIQYGPAGATPVVGNWDGL